MDRANPIMASPSGVIVTLWVSRCTSTRPVASSSLRMCWLTVGWRMPSRAAACVKLRVCATARKVRSRSGSSVASRGRAAELAEPAG